MAIGTVITIISSILVACAGIIVGVVGQVGEAKRKAHFATLEARMSTIEEKCAGFLNFQKESMADRNSLHLGISEMVGDMKVMMERIEQMVSQLDFVYKRILNGNPRP